MKRLISVLLAGLQLNAMESIETALPFAETISASQVTISPPQVIEIVRGPRTYDESLSQNDQLLLLACRTNNPHLAHQALSLGASITLTDQFGTGILTIAIAQRDNDPLVKRLATTKNPIREKTVIDAILEGHEKNTQLVNMLLEKGASVNKSKGAPSNSPLIEALNQKNEQLARILLTKGAITHDCTTNGMGTLTLAVERNFSIAFIKELLRTGASVHEITPDGQTALLKAVINGSLELVNLLIEAGAPVKIKKGAGTHDRAARTSGPGELIPLHVALINRRPDVALALLNHGADHTVVSTTGQTALLLACAHAECAALARHLLHLEADIHIQDADGWTPLLRAASSNQTENAELLIDLGASVNVMTGNGWTPATIAWRWSNLRLLSKLISKKADLALPLDPEKPLPFDNMSPVFWLVDKTEAFTRPNLLITPAHYKQLAIGLQKELYDAVRSGNIQSVKQLLKRGAQLDSTVPLRLAIRNGFKELALKLIKKGVPVNKTPGTSTSPLLDALSFDQLEVADELIKRGAIVDEEGPEGVTALHVALSKNFLDFTLKLLDLKASVNKSTMTGETPLILAAGKEASEKVTTIVRKIISAGGRRDASSQDGWTPLLRACQKNNEEVVTLILGGNHSSRYVTKLVNCYTTDGFTPLLWAVQHNNSTLAQQLLGAGAVPDGYRSLEFLPLKRRPAALIKIMSHQVSTPSFLAIQHGNLQLLDDILFAYPHPNLRLYITGTTPFHLAASLPSLSVLRKVIFQLKHSDGFLYLADARMLDAQGRTALQCALEGQRIENVEMLINAGADCNFPWHEHEYPLHIAVKLKNYELVRILLEAERPNRFDEELKRPRYKTIVDVKDADGCTPLYRAVETGQTAIAQLLLKHGALPGEANVLGMSASSIALSKGDAATVTALARSPREKDERGSPDQ